ncbi:MAG: WYL domain-containing protein [Propionibacteriales bacterium]|nr:WYL domain-containing protein [Propionibacteriales bacterium]
MAAARKSERLMNLVICLLVARTYVGKEKIREVVEGYRDQSDEAFERMFERDKEELRELNIPIEIGHVERAFEDEPGYRIRRDAFELPEIRLEPDEAAVVGVAARVWQHASLAEATSGALLKLRAGGVDVDSRALAVIEPHLAAQEPSFAPVWDAVVTRTPVTFGYRRPGGQEAQRVLEPWGIVSWHGHWYAVGFDRDREAPRVFRLSRITDEARPAGKAGEYDVPPGTDIRKLTANLAPADPTGVATMLVRVGAGLALRRGADTVEPTGEGWDRISTAYSRLDGFADMVVAHGPDVVVEDPAELREAVVVRLRGLVKGGAA